MLVVDFVDLSAPKCVYEVHLYNGPITILKYVSSNVCFLRKYILNLDAFLLFGCYLFSFTI